MAKKLSDESYTSNSLLVSAFAPVGLEFDFDHGGIIGSYADVSVGPHTFRAVKVETKSATVDRYQLSVDWLKSFVALPTYVNAALMSTGVEYRVEGRNSAGLSIASFLEDVYVTFAIPPIKNGDWMNTLFTNGFVRPIYHCGRYSKFDYTDLIFVNGVGYNIQGEEIAWIDREGRWSFWNFKFLSKEFDVKNSGQISTFALRNSEVVGNGLNTEQEIKVQLNFKTVAIDVIHHELLCEIKQSKVVICRDLICNVKECTQTTGAEKQNLAFNLTLEYTENAASY